MDYRQALEKFISDYQGKDQVGNTKENKGQCVGLSEVWLDTIGYPHIWGNASDLLNNADRNFYDVVPNTPTNFPFPGDILVFGAPYGAFKADNGNIGYYGHTGVVIDANVNNVTLFEQNTASGATPHTASYNYSAVIGWIHPKALTKEVAASVNVAPLAGTVDSHGLDLTNVGTLQVLLDTWDDVAVKGVYVKKEDFEKVATELQVVKTELLSTQKGDETLSAEVKAYREMIALGYSSLDDIKSALKSKDDTLLKVIQDMAVVEQKNKTLADLVSSESKNSYTAIDEALSIVKKVQQYESAFEQVAQAAGADKVQVKSIIEKIFGWRDTAERIVRKLEEDERQRKAAVASKSDQTVSVVRTSPGISMLLKIFGLGGGEK